MSEFNLAYQLTLANEGGYSNDVRDRGGETWKGIARRMHPDWPGFAIIDETKLNVNANQIAFALSKDEDLDELVQQFYKVEFWNKLSLDQITEQNIANEVFDTAINQGSVIATKQLQEALNLLNNNQKHYSDINEDGKMGGDTLKAYRAYMLTANFPGRSVDRNVKTLLKLMNGLQAARYAEICEEHPVQEVYFYGWVNRI
jgi:lysozyme family protein